MKAGERVYCEGCFSCGECGAALAGPGTATYTKHDKLYCHDHYMKIFVPVCARCGEYITQVSRASNKGLRRFHNQVPKHVDLKMGPKIIRDGCFG